MEWTDWLSRERMERDRVSGVVESASRVQKRRQAGRTPYASRQCSSGDYWLVLFESKSFGAWSYEFAGRRGFDVGRFTKVNRLQLFPGEEIRPGGSELSQRRCPWKDCSAVGKPRGDFGPN